MRLARAGDAMLRALLAIGSLQFLTVLVLLVRTKTLALLLGPDMVGVMAVTDKLIAVLVQTASLSLPFATIRFLPKLWNEEPPAFVSLFRRMRNLIVLLLVLITTIALALTLTKPRLWGADLLPYRSIVMIAVLGIPVLGLVPFLQNAFAARLERNASMWFGVANAAVFAATGIIGVWFWGLKGSYALYAAAGLFLVIPLLARVGRHPGVITEYSANADRVGQFPISLPRQVWKFCGTLFSLAFFVPFVALYVHYQVLSQLGTAAAGWMQAAIAVSLSVRTVLGQAHQVYLTPNVNLGGAIEERIHWATEFQRKFGFICVALIVPLLLFPRLVVGLLYSRAFLPAAAFVAMFVIMEVLGLLAATYQGLIVAFDHLGFHVMQMVASQMLLLTLAIVFIPRYGIAGVAEAGISAQVMLIFASTLYLRFRRGMKISARSISMVVFVVLSLAIAGGIGAAFRELGVGPILGKLAVYVALLLGLSAFLTSQDRQKLLAAVSRTASWRKPTR